MFYNIQITFTEFIVNTYQPGSFSCKLFSFFTLEMVFHILNDHKNDTSSYLWNVFKTKFFFQTVLPDCLQFISNLKTGPAALFLFCYISYSDHRGENFTSLIGYSFYTLDICSLFNILSNLYFYFLSCLDEVIISIKFSLKYYN